MMEMANGHGLDVSLVPTHAQSSSQLRVQKVNQHKIFLSMRLSNFFVLLFSFMTSWQILLEMCLLAILESVEMSNNNLVFPDEYMIP